MRKLLAVAVLLTLMPRPAAAMPILEFRTHPEEQQRVYALGAVSMLAFSEGMRDKEKRMQCITDWYGAKGEGEFFSALRLSPQAFKQRYGFREDDDSTGYVELLIMRLANDACPA
jgi:hypothetical protein